MIKPKRTIYIPISESDVDMFKGIVYDNDTMEWMFPTEQDGEWIDIVFMSENEHEQRSN
jgi:hypothetical protein